MCDISFLIIYLKATLSTKNELDRTKFIPPRIFRIFVQFLFKFANFERDARTEDIVRFQCFFPVLVLTSINFSALLRFYSETFVFRSGLILTVSKVVSRTIYEFGEESGKSDGHADTKDLTPYSEAAIFKLHPPITPIFTHIILGGGCAVLNEWFVLVRQQ